jgi:trehalose-6-phosphate synthase
LPRLVIVSNRVALPDKQVAGGLAVALHEAFKGHQGLWFGWSGKVAAQATSRPRMVEGGALQYALMDLTPLDRREYYNGFANRALWPTMQIGPLREQDVSSWVAAFLKELDGDHDEPASSTDRTHSAAEGLLDHSAS